MLFKKSQNKILQGIYNFSISEKCNKIAIDKNPEPDLEKNSQSQFTLSYLKHNFNNLAILRFKMYIKP